MVLTSPYPVIPPPPPPPIGDWTGYGMHRLCCRQYASCVYPQEDYLVPNQYNGEIFTDRSRRMGEGNVFTDTHLSVQGERRSTPVCSQVPLGGPAGPVQGTPFPSHLMHSTSRRVLPARRRGITALDRESL